MPALLTGSTGRPCARGPGKAPKQTSAPFLPKQNTLCASFLGGGPRTFLLPRANRFSSLTCLGPGGQRHLPSGAASTGPALPLKAVTSGAGLAVGARHRAPRYQQVFCIPVQAAVSHLQRTVVLKGTCEGWH